MEFKELCGFDVLAREEMEKISAGQTMAEFLELGGAASVTAIIAAGEATPDRLLLPDAAFRHIDGRG